MVDMINVKDIESRAVEIDALGVDYICVHSGYDHQAEGKNSFEELVRDQTCREARQDGGCGRNQNGDAPEVIQANPDLVIVGGESQVNPIKSGCGPDEPAC